MTRDNTQSNVEFTHAGCFEMALDHANLEKEKMQEGSSTPWHEKDVRPGFSGEFERLHAGQTLQQQLSRSRSMHRTRRKRWSG